MRSLRDGTRKRLLSEELLACRLRLQRVGVGVLVLLVAINGAVFTLPLWLDGIPFAPDTLAVMLVVSFVLQLLISEPLVATLQYVVLGDKALYVVEGGNGGVALSAVAPARDSSSSSSSALSKRGPPDSEPTDIEMSDHNRVSSSSPESLSASSAV